MSLRVKDHECVILKDQISEAASSSVKYLLFLRSTGEFDYTNLVQRFHIATIGLEGICCDSIDVVIDIDDDAKRRLRQVLIS